MAEADKIDVEMKAAGIEDGTPVMTKPIVYKRRFFVLLRWVFCLYLRIYIKHG